MVLRQIDRQKEQWFGLEWERMVDLRLLGWELQEMKD
jgi:hypothetical protein